MSGALQKLTPLVSRITRQSSKAPGLKRGYADHGEVKVNFWEKVRAGWQRPRVPGCVGGLCTATQGRGQRGPSSLPPFLPVRLLQPMAMGEWKEEHVRIRSVLSLQRAPLKPYAGGGGLTAAPLSLAPLSPRRWCL